MEGSDEASIAYGRSTLENRSAQPGDGAIQLGPLIEVDAGKVQFPKIAGIIHVIEQGVHIGAQADACSSQREKEGRENKYGLFIEWGAGCLMGYSLFTGA